MQFSRHQTIAELAAVAGTAQAVQAEQAPVTGAAPLMPYQRWFFDQQPPDPHHWNIAVLVELRERADLDLMERAVLHLLVHHDALRLRFEEDESGWHQRHAGLAETPGAPVFVRASLSHLSSAQQELAYER